MSRHRFAVILPVFFVVISLLLWFWARSQYQAFVHSAFQAKGVATEWQDVMWTDYSPLPLEFAGALNVPVATFVAPLYALVHPETSTWTLIAALVGVAGQWFCVGFVCDRKKPQPSTWRARVVAVIGILFGVFLVIVSVPMFHVGFIYKGAAVIWALFICWYFSKAFRPRRLTERDSPS